MTYYQIGGFRSQIQWFQSTYDDKKLAESIAGLHSPLRDSQESTKPVELVLGIKRIGTSHLLLTSDQAEHCSRRLNLPRPRGPPIPTTAFESLSPIYFYDTEELSKKLSTLKPKSAKGRVPTDTSQANKGYTQGEDGIYRGGFEHCRVFWLVLQNSIPNVRKFGLEDTAWSRSIRVISVVYNTRKIDERPARERLERPFVLDIGYAETTIPDISAKLDTVKHLFISSNKFVGRGDTKITFKFGNTEMLHESDVASRVRDLFKDYIKPTATPVILLVHNEQVTRNALRNMGVDVSVWGSGIKDFILPPPYSRDLKYNKDSRTRPLDPRAASTSSRPYDEYEQRRTRPRSRSRSPQRGSSSLSSYSYSSGNHNNRPRSPQRQNSNGGKVYKPVYVVDIQRLYTKLMQTDYNAECTTSIARHLGISDEEGWCAGNEAALIIDVWRSMISGPPIDEQRAQRMERVSNRSQADMPACSTNPLADLGGDDSDDEDPNDIIQGGRGAAPSAATLGSNPYDAFDVSDYGDSDDSE